MPWYSDCPRCREAFDAAIAHDDAGSRALLPPANNAAPKSALDHDRPNTFQLIRSGRQTLRHYLPRAVAATLSAAVFCLTGVFSTLSGTTAEPTAQPVNQVGRMNSPATGTDRNETPPIDRRADLTAANLAGNATSAGFLQLSPTAMSGGFR